MGCIDFDRIENVVIILAASAPTIRPLFKKKRENSQNKTTIQQSQNSNSRQNVKRSPAEVESIYTATLINSTNRSVVDFHMTESTGQQFPIDKHT